MPLTEAGPRWPVVLFDFDGTLGDTVALIVNSFRHALGTVAGASVAEEVIRSWIGRPLAAVFQEEYPDHVEALTDSYREWNLANHDEQIKQVAGIDEVVRALAAAGVRLGVVSSKPAGTVRQGLRALGLHTELPVVVGSEQTERHKPHPDPLLYAVRRLGAAPAEAVYIGDAVVDLRSAAAAGMSGIGVTWGAGVPAALRAEHPAALVDDAAGLQDVLLPA